MYALTPSEKDEFPVALYDSNVRSVAPEQYEGTKNKVEIKSSRTGKCCDCVKQRKSNRSNPPCVLIFPQSVINQIDTSILVFEKQLGTLVLAGAGTLVG